MVTFETALSRNDLRELGEEAFFKDIHKKKRCHRLRIIAYGLFILNNVIFGILYAGKIIGIKAMPIVVLISAIFLLIARNLKKIEVYLCMYAIDENDFFQKSSQRRKYSIDSNGISIKVEYIEIHVKWDGCMSWSENDNFIKICLKKDKFIFFKQTDISYDQRKELYEYLRKNICNI